MNKKNQLSGSRRHSHEDLEVLYRISNLVNTTLDRHKVFKAILKEVVRLTGATSGSIAMLDPQRGVLNIESAINIPARTWKRLKLQLGVGVTGWAAYKGETVRVNDVWRDPHYVAVKQDIRSELAVPMVLQNQVIGVINVDSTSRDAFTEEDQRLLEAVAGQSAKVIETARLYDALKRYSRRMEMLVDTSRHLVSPAPGPQIIATVTRVGRKLTETDACLFVELSPSGAELRILAQEGVRASWTPSPAIDWRESLLAPVVSDRSAVRVADMRSGNPFWKGMLPLGNEFHALLAVPVLYEERIHGALVALNRTPRQFNEQDTQILQLLANQTAVALENANRLDRILATEESLHRVERFSLLGGLAAEIAHEIRNPVAIINLLLDSMIEGAESPRTQEDLGIVREKVARIDRIVQQTLNMARSPRAEDLQRTSINDVLSDVLVFLNYKFAKSCMELAVSLDQSIPEVEMDRGQIQQVFLNLIMNALEAMQGTQGRLGITTFRTEDPELGECAAAAFQDSGRGIAHRDIESLFEPFYTTRVEGTGLGLFITRKLVAAHGGEVRVQSLPGKGSTFTVLLPLERGHAALPASNEDGEFQRNTMPPQEGAKH